MTENRIPDLNTAPFRLFAVLEFLVGKDPRQNDRLKAEVPAGGLLDLPGPGAGASHRLPK